MAKMGCVLASDVRAWQPDISVGLGRDIVYFYIELFIF